VRAQRLAQRRHQISLNHVEEDARTGILSVEQAVELIARQDEQKCPLARDSRERGSATVDQVLVAERRSRPRQSDPDKVWARAVASRLLR
jgi:hypothetical protein